MHELGIPIAQKMKAELESRIKILVDDFETETSMKVGTIIITHDREEMVGLRVVSHALVRVVVEL